MRQLHVGMFSSAAIVVGVFVGDAHGQTMSQAGSGAQAYFGSQSGAYLDSNPSVGAYPFPGVTGAYAVGAGLPGIPSAPVPPVVPGPYPGVNFQTAGGVTSVFNDGLPISSVTKAKSIIADSYVPIPANTADAAVIIPSWQFDQALGATGYVWEQINFAADYVVDAPFGLAGSTPAFTLAVNGSVATGGFVQFDGVVNYNWIPVNTALIPTGLPVSLGTLTYTYSSSGAGTFATTITSAGTLANTPVGTGVLELTGHMWIAGDPFSIEVASLPEPASIGVFALAGMAVLSRRSRKSRD